MESAKGKCGCLKRVLLAAALVLPVLALALVLSLPLVLTHVRLPRLSFDVSAKLKGKTAELVANKTITVEAEPWRKDPAGNYVISAWGRLLDWPYRANVYVRSLFPRVEGDMTLVLDEFWRLQADFSARSTHNWSFHASVPATQFSEESAVISDILARLTPPAVSNLIVSGAFALSAEGASTPKVPVPAWKLNGSLRNADMSCKISGKDVDIDGLRLGFGAEGIANHTTIAPLYPRADMISAAGFALSNVAASVRATERSYLITEASAACCGGELKLYSLFLDPERLSAGATIFVDGVDAGEVLAHVSGFNGNASGRLHGKLPFFLKGGRELRLKNAYLFSSPGETGKIEIFDAKPVLDSLASGIAQSERDNFSKALSNLDYKVLKLELKRGADGADATLGLKIEGSATHAGTTVPVDIAINFRGDLDQIVNTGMKFKGRKGKETTR